MPILTSLQHWAESSPDRVALAVDGETVGYAALRDRVVERLTPMPTPEGRPAPGLTVIDRLDSVDAVVRLLAGMAGSGCVAVLDPNWPAEQRAAVEERLRGWAPASGLSGPGARTNTGLTDTGLADGPAESTFLIGFTSGTTALPKAFSRTRGSWLRSLQHSAEALHLTGQDRTLAPGPLSTGLNLYALIESLHAGGSFHSLTAFDVATVLHSLDRDRITRLVAVPTVLRILADRAMTAGRLDHALTGIVSGGATLDAATTGLLQRWAPAATIASYYGAGELGFVAVSSLAPGETPPTADTAVGLSFPGVRIRIAHDDGRPADIGEPATIRVRSDLVCDGYLWGDDGAAFERVGDWCTVGDQGYLDESGVLHVLGRRADMVVSAGSNVYPQQVEAVLHRVPGVEAAVVTARPDPVRGARVVAAVIAVPDLPVDLLRQACLTGLVAAHRPREFFRLSELPLTTAGKVSRRTLARWIEQEDPRAVPLR